MDVTAASQEFIRTLMATHTGQQITDERVWRIPTALAGLFREYRISNVDQLVCLLTMPGHGDLETRVVEALLNNETYFFRDLAYFQTVRDLVIPHLKEARAEERRLRIWSAGCSTGQEALSLAMIFAENAAAWKDWTVEIVGSDVSARAISVAKSGRYSQFEIQRGISVSQMITYFDETEDGWQANESLRQFTHFEQANLLDMELPTRPYDLVLCRNVMLYFEAKTRSRIFDTLLDSVRTDGWLMLGAGETAVGHTDRFKPAHCGNALYRVTEQTEPMSQQDYRRERRSAVA